MRAALEKTKRPKKKFFFKEEGGDKKVPYKIIKTSFAYFKFFHM